MVIGKRDRESIVLAALLLGAAGLWYWIFAVPAGNFWIKLALSAGVLAALAVSFTGKGVGELLRFKVIDLPIGVLSAAGLYAVFFVGNIVLTAVFPAAEAGIQRVYAPKSALPSRAVGALLLSATAVAEEIFWRGFVQRAFVRRTRASVGAALGVLCYAGVHAWTLNVPLMLAAAVAGTVWAVQFQLCKRLPSVILSHALWSMTIFLFVPVG